jgi:hypothetical protein
MNSTSTIFSVAFMRYALPPTLYDYLWSTAEYRAIMLMNTQGLKGSTRRMIARNLHVKLSANAVSACALAGVTKSNQFGEQPQIGNIKICMAQLLLQNPLQRESNP